MIIYKSNGDVRATIEVSEDAEVLLQVSDECSFTTKVTLATFVAFSVGDYVEVFGERYHIAKKPTPTKHGTNKYEWTLKFVDARDYLSNVSLYLSDGTALLAYDADTIYCYDAVCSHDSKIWRYVYPTADKNHTPTEDDYWDEVLAYNIATPYAVGATVHQSNVVYRCIQANTGASLTDDTFWSVMNTAPMWDFATVLSPTDYAQLICDCMNRETTQTWVVGSCIAATPRETTFSNVQCLDAAASVAELFETEMFIDMNGTDYRLNFNKLAYTSDPQITLSQGEGYGLTNISVQENTSSKKVTRLVALGGTKNLNGTYRNGSKRLMLPNAYYLDSLLRDPADPRNATVTWDDIYPALTHATEDFSDAVTYQIGEQVLYAGQSYDCTTKHTEGAWNAANFTLSEGQVTTVITAPTATTAKFKFIDTQLSFNPLDPKYIMADGTLPKVHFITGNMAGYEFPVLECEANGLDGFLLTIQQIQDSTDSNLPTVGYMFDVSDMYYFTDIYMPKSYVAKAELRLKAKALDYLSKYEKDQITYSCSVDIIKATNDALELHKGEIVKLIDTDFGLNDDYRIVSLRRKYRKPYKYDITLSDLPYIPTRITKIENNIKQNETYIERSGLTSLMAKSRTFQGAQEAINKAFDPSGEYFTNVIKPLIVETSAVLVGTNEQQFDLNGIAFNTKTNQPNYIEWTSGTIYNGGLDEPHDAWNVSGGSATMGDTSKSYYCYIVAERSIASTSAHVSFEENQHLTKEDPALYYFLIGTLGSVKSNFRQFWTSYGFSFVNGGQIVTNEIRNTQGTVILGLGSERLYIGNGTNFIDMDVYNNKFEMNGITLVQTTVKDENDNTSMLTVDRGVWVNTDAYVVGNLVTYLGSTYYCYANSEVGNPPTDTTKWRCYAIGGLTINQTNQNVSVRSNYSEYNDEYRGRTLRALGDSFTAGYRATDLYGYVDYICSELGSSKVNMGIPGGQIVDIAVPVIDLNISYLDVCTFLPGFNDCANFGGDDSDGRKLLAYSSAVLATAVSMTIPETGKVRGDNPLITYAGTWYSPTVGGISSFAKASGTADSTASFAINGDVLYINYIQQYNNTNSFAVYSDGVLINTQICAGWVSNGGAISSRVFEPALLRIDGLGAGSHNIVIKVLQTSASYHLFLQWVATPTSVSAPVFIGNPCRENALGVASNAGTNYGKYTIESNRLFKQVSESIASTLRGDGLNVKFVDTDDFSAEFADGMEDPDGIHPNDFGHLVIRNSFMDIITGGRVLSTLGSGQTIEVWDGSVKLEYNPDLNNGQFMISPPSINPVNTVFLAGQTTGIGTNTVTVADYAWIGFVYKKFVLSLPVTIKRLDGTQVVIYANQTVSKVMEADVPKSGAAISALGVWVPGKTYYGNTSRIDAVKYGNIWYKAKTTAGVFSDAIWNPLRWDSFGGQFESVATDTLLAENANIAGFIYKDQKMVSQAETGGVPNIILDGVNGAAELTGNINAGTIGGETNGFVIADGRIGTIVDLENPSGSVSITKDLMRIGGLNGTVLIGDNVIDEAGGYTSTGRVMNNRVDFSRPNVGLKIEVSGGKTNIGILSDNALRAPSFIQNVAKVWNVATTSTFDFSVNNLFIAYSDYNIQLDMPSQTLVEAMFGLGVLPTDFATIFTIHHGNQSAFTIQLNGITDQNGTVLNRIIGVGDTEVIMCTTVGGFRYQELSRWAE